VTERSLSAERKAAPNVIDGDAREMRAVDHDR